MKATLAVGAWMGRNTAFDATLPGTATVIEAVEGEAMSDARIAAVTRELLTNVVARGLPFQYTTEFESNPVPLTVSVNPLPPGATALGISG